MCGKGSCARLGYLHSTTYIRAFPDFHSLPWQDSLLSDDLLTTTIADAPGLSWDYHYQPWLVEGWQSLKAGRSRTIGLPDVIAGASRKSLGSILGAEIISEPQVVTYVGKTLCNLFVGPVRHTSNPR